MRKLSRGVLLFFLLLLGILLGAYTNSEKKQVKEAVVSEFNQLKNLDPDTVQQYLASEGFFLDASASQASASTVEEVASLFFKDFDYKILTIHAKEAEADCSVQITTLDAHVLSKDYQKEYLTEAILATANGQVSQDTSLEQRYLLLKNLIENHTYQTVSNSCKIHLIKIGKEWQIQKDQNLKNQLVGGFISAIANPYLLTPAETTEVYFQTLKNMNDSQTQNYLGLTELLNNSDPDSQAVAEALIEQMRACLDYRIVDSQDNGTIATVNAEITSFSCSEILSQYNQKTDEYLATPEALIDGPEGRLEKCSQILLECITGNTATQSQSIPLSLINDGVSWKLQSNVQLGAALFGDFQLSDSSEEDSSE